MTRLRNIIARKTESLIVGGLSVLLLTSIAFSLHAQAVGAKPGDVRKQLGQAGSPTTGSAQTQPPKQAPAPKAPAKPAKTAQTAPQPAPKSATVMKAPATPKKAAPAGGAEVKPVADHPAGPRRDPFEPLVGREKTGPLPENLPPGKAGLQIATLRLDGIVRGPNGMIAVVSNSQQRVYFLRDGDHLYDGDVEHITMEGVSFHQTGTDPFGKPVEREVTKRLFPSPGE